MEQLPLEIENIILDYKAQLEHIEKFKHVLSNINDMKKTFEESCAEYVKETGEYPETFPSYYLDVCDSKYFKNFY